MICDGDRFEKIFEREREFRKKRECVEDSNRESYKIFKKKIDLIHIQIISITHHPITHT